jgi:hypothetical protein
VGGSCDYGNEPLGSIKYRGFIESLRTCQLLKNYSAPWSLGTVKGSYLIPFPFENLFFLIKS